MYHEKHKAFTLAELIVAIPLLPVILATIGFSSYAGYQASARDASRLAQIVSVSDGLHLYSTKADLPLPDDNVEIVTGSSVIAYQGYAGSNTLESIDFTKGGTDPKDGNYFSYYLTADRKYFQIMAFLEEEKNTISQNTFGPKPITSMKGVDYSDRFPSVFGKKLGIFTDVYNVPIQEISLINTEGFLDISKNQDTSGYIAHLSNTSKIRGTATDSPFQYIDTIAVSGGIYESCSVLLDRKRRFENESGIYFIDPDGKSPSPTYCDMSVN